VPRHITACQNQDLNEPLNGPPHEARDLSIADFDDAVNSVRTARHVHTEERAPWCVALHDRQVASVAFAARLSKAGAEIGVATAPEMRGRGYAATAVARWSRLRSLRSRALFYSTDQTNGSSQRVAARLGLRFLGASVRLS